MKIFEKTGKQDNAMRFAALLIAAFGFVACANSSGGASESNSGNTTTVTGAAAQGCQSSQAAFRVMNANSSTSTLSINNAANCVGTAYPNPAASLAQNAYSAYICVSTGTYYAKRNTECGFDSISFSTNKVYKVAIDYVFGTVKVSTTEE